ncbi:uncharacterized protein LOC132745783 [Ruditapes philippinarum]|uniref:uncharacterized protein LOC132745783 n=1 Tax=Ruditapes philippinarum TaxID=129788 RepID=UPI00295C0528|nr:uncharacterized protein LOC132745783 [Ruditapes philippinarum]
MAVPGKKPYKQFSSSTLSMGSDEDLKVYCQPCDRDGLTLPAYGYCTNCSEHLCETCFRAHRRHTLSRHHNLLDKISMPPTLSTATQRQPDNFTNPCPKHNAEMVKFYCHDHKALLCSVCVTLEHTATPPCNVNYIPDISGKTINSNEYQDVLTELSDLAERSNKTLQDMKEMNVVSNKSLMETLTHIMKFRTKINERLDELERQVKEAAKVIQEDNIKIFKSVETVCRDVSKSLKSSSDAIKHFNASKEANDLFMELKHAEQMIKEYEQKVDKVSEFEVKEYNFEPNEAISNLLNKEMSLGTLKGRTLHPDLKYRRFSQMDIICMKRQDKDTCIITGMTLLTPDLLIITDYQNRAIKMVEISKKSVQARHNFDSDPWDVTSISQNEVAVTLPFNLTIQFLSVSRNKIKIKHTLKVDGECHGISFHKDKMVVSFCNPAKVQIMLINGTVIQTIQGEIIFKDPLYITTSDNCIFVSDLTMKTVTKLNWQSEVKGKYVCTANPHGLTMSDDGTVYVCYCDNNTIEEISEDFSKEQVVVKDIQNPQAVYWSAETCTLFTNSWDYTGEDNFIKLFKTSK